MMTTLPPRVPLAVTGRQVRPPGAWRAAIGRALAHVPWSGMVVFAAARRLDHSSIDAAFGRLLAGWGAVATFNGALNACLPRSESLLLRSASMGALLLSATVIRGLMISTCGGARAERISRKLYCMLLVAIGLPSVVCHVCMPWDEVALGGVQRGASVLFAFGVLALVFLRTVGRSTNDAPRPGYSVSARSRR